MRRVNIRQGLVPFEAPVKKSQEQKHNANLLSGRTSAKT